MILLLVNAGRRDPTTNARPWSAVRGEIPWDGPGCARSRLMPLQRPRRCRSRLGELDTEVQRLDARIERHQIAQRATVAGGENVNASDDAALIALGAERVALRDQQLLLGERLGRPPAAAGPHDHLRHRRVPLPTETTGQRRVLAIRSAVSTSVVLVVPDGHRARAGVERRRHRHRNRDRALRPRGVGAQATVASSPSSSPRSSSSAGSCSHSAAR